MPISLWFDGCFDGFHYAHANAVRQALYLIEGERNPRILVGVHSDEAILENKGPTLFDQIERYNLVRGCRWVDQVVENAPYVTCFEVTQRYHVGSKIFKAMVLPPPNNIGVDFVIHGDDIVLDAQGNDCYAAFKAAGKYKECKRTEGISTTSLIERILHPKEWASVGTDNAKLKQLLDLFVTAIPYLYPVIRYENLASPTYCETIRQKWPPYRKVIYLGGSWDCFGAGHVELLRRAKSALSDVDNALLIVGVWSDELLESMTGERPLLTLMERALAIVQCKYSDALILSAPEVLTQQIVDSLAIRMIVNSKGFLDDVLVKHMQVDIPPLQTVAELRKKLLAQHSLYKERQRRKLA